MGSNFLMSQGNGVDSHFRRRIASAMASVVAPALWARAAMAHASERSQIMLLPTYLYILGGALAVLGSIFIAAFLPVVVRWRTPRWEFHWRAVPTISTTTSLASLALLFVLVFAGWFGPSDPVSNPLPAFVWSVWWVGFTLFCLLLGNLWPLFNPWTGLFRLFGSPGPLLQYPSWLGHWLAVCMFFAFAWFELVYPAPVDPPRLAAAVTGYFAANLLALFVFGERQWMRKAEVFSAYFRMVGKLSPFQWSAADGSVRLDLGLPGHGLISSHVEDGGEAAFILLALAAVSFDGFSQTFFWVDRLGLNPLEFPGRSAVVLANTAGLAFMALCLWGAYNVALKIGSVVARPFEVPSLIVAIVPIAIAYHLAHYLADFPVDVMRAIKAMSDPFGTGADLFGTAAINPPASIMMDHHLAALVYSLQTAIIVAGHVMAVVVSHIRMLHSGINIKTTVLSQAPLNSLMVLYTVFGLWLLSTPVIS
jgi:hypothetical protein